MKMLAIYEDERLTIRRLAEEEAPALLEAVRDSLVEVGQWESWCVAGYSLQDAVAVLQEADTRWTEASAFDFYLIARDTGDVLGAVSVNQIHYGNQIGNVSYWIRTGYTGRGLASLAAREAARFAFDQLGLSRVEIVVLEENVRSQRVAQKAGATLECLARNRLQYLGTARHAKVYSLIPLDLLDGF